MRTTAYALMFMVFLVCSVHAETYCQNVNRTRTVTNSASLARSMNKWIALKGSNYKTNSKEITNVITTFCKSKPYGTADDVTNHLETLIGVLAAVDK